MTTTTRTTGTARRGPVKTMLVMFTLFALLAGACGGSDPESADPGETDGSTVPGDGAPEPVNESEYASGGTVRLRINDVWRSFDIQNVGEGITHRIASNIYATLLYQYPDGELTGYLAEEWEVEPDSITFTLRDDAFCADGTPVTPTVVANSLQRMIDAEAQYNSLLFGPGPYEVIADDEAGTVEFNVGTPYSYLEYAFANNFPGTSTGIICPAGLEAGADLENNLYGAGPYTVSEVVDGEQITLELRDDFAWGPDGVTAETPGIAETVVYQVVNNTTTAANLLLTGDLDIAEVAGPDRERLQNEPDVTAFQAVNFAVLPLTFNHLEGHPTADPALRQALITAVDPARFVEAAWRGEAQMGPSIIPEQSRCFDPSVSERVPEPSIDAARQVLADNGYDVSGDTVTLDGEPVEITVILSNQLDPAPEYLRDVWTELGVEVDLRSVDYQVYVSDAILDGQHDVSLMQTSAPAPIPGPLGVRTTGALPTDGVNYTWIIDSELDEMVSEAVTLLGEEECELWSQYQHRLWDEWHLLPLGMPYNYTFGQGVDMSRGIRPLEFRVLAD